MSTTTSQTKNTEEKVMNNVAKLREFLEVRTLGQEEIEDWALEISGGDQGTM